MEYDSDDSDKTFQVHKSESIINLFAKGSTINLKRDSKENNQIRSIDRSVCTSLPLRNIIAQEIFTQTSKTIIELAQNEINIPLAKQTLETQTSFVSIIENKSIEYKIQVLRTNRNDTPAIRNYPDTRMQTIDQNIIKSDIQNVYSMLEKNSRDNSPIFGGLAIENNSDRRSLNNSDDDVIHFIEDDSKDNSESKVIHNAEHNYTSEFESNNFESDFENDSLMENEYCYDKTRRRDENSETSEIPNCIDSDVEELYNRLSESPRLLSPILSAEPAVRNFAILTPLTEETAQKKESIVDLTPSARTLMKACELNSNNDMFVNNCGVKVNVLSDNNISSEEQRNFKLPPIYNNQSYPNSPHLNFFIPLNNQRPFGNTCILPSLYDRHSDKYLDRWEISNKELASGESPRITGKNGKEYVFGNNFIIKTLYQTCVKISLAICRYRDH